MNPGSKASQNKSRKTCRKSFAHVVSFWRELRFWFRSAAITPAMLNKSGPARHGKIVFPVSLTSGFCQDLTTGFLGGETQGRASALHAISGKLAHRIGPRIEPTTR